LTLPFQDSLLYLRPVYAKEEQSGRYALKKVVVASGDTVGFGDTVEAAVADLLDQDPDRASGGTATAPTTTVPSDGSSPPSTSTPSTASELLAAADAKFTDAEERLRNGDLGGYEQSIEAARDLVRQAGELLNASAPAPSGG
jgi:uncharacterized membrane protein (UPF0182 family)